MDEAPTRPHEKRMVRLALPAPDLQREILLGQHHKGITLEALKSTDILLCWADKVSVLGCL